MNEFYGFIFNVVISLIFLGVAYFTGKFYENRHYASIIKREQALSHIIITTTKRPPADFCQSTLVKGNVVVSSDYFRRFLAGFVHVSGGNIASYERLLDRAKREAILRMKEEAKHQGANIIFNVKIETTNLDDIHTPKANTQGTIEVLAYGTAGRVFSTTLETPSIHF